MAIQSPSDEKGIARPTDHKSEQQTSASKDQLTVNSEPTEKIHSISETDWSTMSEDWQSQPFTKIDIQRLLSQTQRRTLWAKLCLGLNFLASFFIFFSFIYGLTLGDYSQLVNIYLGFGSILSFVFMYYELKIRLKVWQSCCDSPDKAIQNAMTGIESSIKYCRLTKLSIVPFFILFNWFCYAVTSEQDKSIWLPLLIVNGFLLTVYITTDIMQRKRQAQYQQLKSAIYE